jgi:pantothenate kinase
MSSGTSSKSSSKKTTKKITTAANEVKETKSVSIMVNLNILKVLINERPLIPLLRVLKKNKELHTRELLITMGSWGYGQSLMKSATNLGLIERKVKEEKSRGRGKPRIYNSLTNKGREVVGLADKVGYGK